MKEAIARIKPFVKPLYIAHNKGTPMQMSMKFMCLKVGIFCESIKMTNTTALSNRHLRAQPTNFCLPHFFERYIYR